MQAPHHQYDANVLRDTPIVSIIERMGGVERGTKPSHASRKFRIGARNFVVAPARNVFRDVDTGSGGRGAINFMIALTGCTYRDALKAVAGAPVLTPACRVDAKSRHVANGHTSEPVPEHNAAVWPSVRKYLTCDRRIPSAMVDHLRSIDVLRAGLVQLSGGQRFGNAVFVCRSDLTPALACSIRGTGRNAFKQYRGPLHPNIIPVFSLGDGQEAWIVESALEAISVCVLVPGIRAVSLSGDHSSIDSPAVAAAIGGRHVVIATNRDEGGARSEERIRRLYPDASREAPAAPNVDWNDVLRARA